MAENTRGRVAGWGLTENEVYSPVLKIIDLQAASYWTCRYKSSVSFVPYITTDKFCGHRDNENVCEVQVLEILPLRS